ncbi:LacI family DNA-binding transcriptional regulator [Plantibacter auratus]|uniref:LacI family DNA-binding transcriptional regulator n=1 Tax=Plantibacter auratus TaxID=272914 RepID=UPI003D350D53
MSTPTTGPARRPTIDDVAAAAGVSRGTVSRAMNGHRWVSEEARRAVEAAVRSTGYRANAHARGLKLRRSGSVAFLLGEDVDHLFSDPNFAVLMKEVSTALAERNIAMVLLLASSLEEQRRALDFIGTGQIDGVMFVSWNRELGVLDQLTSQGVPTIYCGTPVDQRSTTSYVAADDRDGARTMTEHLLGLGRSRVVMIAGPPLGVGGLLRVDGYRDALGSDGTVVHGDWSRQSGADAMERLLADDPTIDAVFAANDLMASGAIQVLMAHGRRVPDDVAVGGFDDSAAAVASSPTITTMRQPFPRIAREMTRLLLEQIEGQQPAHVVLRTEFVPRESA